ncbi:peptidase E [Hyunsoonleella flava]|uniref:Peptidase E n=1 Tax=Hyunsoonleella flava TaxID=2527939 RepID=A0A4Q9FFZ0_9FLAO|nr:DUF6702 family protein [Hyunsoonleella flava]TBN05527.1 peptidase E [Hyunsoonleella flava]
MKLLKTIIVLLVVLAASSHTLEHKYYISNTQIEYVEEKASVQIISRIFIDDFENVLKERYDEDLTFDGEDDLIDLYIKRYLGEKLRININGESKQLLFIGREVEMGIVKCYLEIENVASIDTFEVVNQTLFDLFSEQQNIIKLDINSKKKSFVLTKQNDKAVLNFN